MLYRDIIDTLDELWYFSTQQIYVALPIHLVADANLRRFACVSRTVNTWAEEEETHAREDRIVGNHWRSAGKRSHGHHRQEREEARRKERRSRSRRGILGRIRREDHEIQRGFARIRSTRFRYFHVWIHSLLERNKAIREKNNTVLYSLEEKEIYFI